MISLSVGLTRNPLTEFNPKSQFVKIRYPIAIKLLGIPYQAGAPSNPHRDPCGWQGFRLAGPQVPRSQGQGIPARMSIKVAGDPFASAIAESEFPRELETNFGCGHIGSWLPFWYRSRSDPITVAEAESSQGGEG